MRLLTGCRALIALALVAIPLQAGALPSEPARFTHISIDEGLSQGRVACITQDRTGYMWFGTQDGLNRYDGYEFVLFGNDPRDPQSLTDNTVHVLAAAEDGGLWAGTERGLNYYSPLTGKFERFVHDPDDPASPSSGSVHALYVQADGRVWVGGTGGIDLLDPMTKACERFGDVLESSVGGKHVRDIAPAPDGALWVVVEWQVYLFDPKSRSAERIPGATLGAVRTLHVDRAGELWVGSMGLQRLTSNRELVTFPLMAKGEKVINDICEDAEGRLWLAGFEGLFTIDADRSGATRYVGAVWTPGVEGSLPSRVAVGTNLATMAHLCVYADRTGTVWAGTNGFGLQKWNRYTDRFRLAPGLEDDGRPGASVSVRGICEMSDGSLLVGTYRGLRWVDPWPSVSEREPPKWPQAPERLHVARAILPDKRAPERLVWVGTEGTGLARIDLRTGAWEEFPCVGPRGETDAGQLVGQIVYAVNYAPGGLWIGSGLGLNFYDEATGEFEWIPEATRRPGKGRLAVHDIVESDGSLWLATSGGVFEFDPATRRSTGHAYDSDNPNSISSDDVFCIYEDSRGVLWFGTRGGGLNRLDRESGRFEVFTTADGLANNVVYGILEDKRGRLWLSTNRGLSRFDPDSRDFHNFGASDGLQSNEFNSAAYHLGASGRMYFGGINGVSSFVPEQVEFDPIAPEVVITRIVVTSTDGERTEFGAGAIHALHDGLELSHRDVSVRVEYAATHYAKPSDNTYAYRLGDDDGWQNVGTTRFTTLWGLRPGDYKFSVKAANHDGTWNDQPASLAIAVVPPFWGTLWFRGGLLVFVATLLFVVHRVRVTLVERRSDEVGRLNAQLMSEIAKGKEHEVQAERAAELFKAVIAQSPAAIIVADAPSGRIRHVNGAIKDVTGHTAEEIMKLQVGEDDATWQCLNPDGTECDPDDLPLARSVLRGETTVGRELIIRQSDGGVRWILANAAPVRDATGEVIAGMGVYLDSTDLFESRERLRDLAWELSRVEVAERRNLATYVHDNLSQALALLRLRVGGLREYAESNAFLEAVESIRRLLDQAIEDTRTLTFDLSPPVLNEFGLGAAVEWIGEKTCEQNALEFEFSESADTGELDADTAAQMYRGTRELIMNVVKHANASKITARVDVDDHEVAVQISDDGVGFDASDTSKLRDSFGLMSIAERMRYIGGRLEVDAAQGRGTRAVLIAPRSR